MNVFKNKGRIIVTCNNRLSPYVLDEVHILGFDHNRVFKTGVELTGSIEDCIWLNLNLYCANQVLFSLMEFQTPDPDELYRKVYQYPWEDLVSNEAHFTVTSHVSHPKILNSLFVNVKVKDAIVDRIREKTGKRPDSGSQGDGAVIHLYWKDNYAEVFMDTTGMTLAKHGYRKIPGKAPLQEALAAGLMRASRWQFNTPLVNPMCGSGTLAIEAALWATRRGPGLFRTNYSFSHFKGFEKALYEKMKEQLANQVEERTVAIWASDNDPKAIEQARKNARAAGVESYIQFEVCDFEECTVPQGEEGVIIFNPEYGLRLGEDSLLEKEYRRIGDFMKQHCQGYRGYIFTGNTALAKKVGLKASKRLEFYSAKLDCRLLEYELYAGSRRTIT